MGGNSGQGAAGDVARDVAAGAGGAEAYGPEALDAPGFGFFESGHWSDFLDSIFRPARLRRRPLQKQDQPRRGHLKVAATKPAHKTKSPRAGYLARGLRS